MLGGGAATVKQTAAGLELSVPENARDPMVTIVELTMDTEVKDMVQNSKPQSPVNRKSDTVPPPREEIQK